MGAEKTAYSFGTFPRGPRNLITDVPGVQVGHRTLAEGDIQTGVTAILPAPGNLFREKVPAACHVINGFGKAMGLSQVQEIGTIETPVILTNTLAVGTGFNAVVRRCLRENPEVGLTTGTVNPLVLDCNDGAALNDVRGMHVTEADVWAAIDAASADFAEGSVGAGRGMCCYGLKGGIGSASRVIAIGEHAYTLGVLVLTNYGEAPDLRLGGELMGRRLPFGQRRPDRGSCAVLLATDLPLSTRQMGRVCRRTQSGLARTGAYVANGSGETAVMFSTAYRVPHFPAEKFLQVSFLHEDTLDLVFRAATDCIEEAVVSALFHAETVVGRGGKCRKSLRDLMKELEGQAEP